MLVRINHVSIPELNRLRKTVKRHKQKIVNAYVEGKTNSKAEAVNQGLRNIIRDTRGFHSFEAMRSRCLIIYGHKRYPKSGVSLYS